jgi:imidazolonepropionase-like amidohydrolase
MAHYLISNCQLIDGTGAAPRQGAAVLIEGDRIRAVGSTDEVRAKAAARPGFEEIDARGRTVMPGLIEGHVHLNFHPCKPGELDLHYPAVYMGMLALRHSSLLLQAGYTSAVGGGCQFNLDVWVKRAIQAGLARGPRLFACSREITTTGGPVDTHASWRKMGLETLGYVADGPEEITKAVRTLLKEGVDSVKIYTSGEGSITEDYHPSMVTCQQDRETMTPQEIQAAVEEVRRWKKTIIAHTRDAQSIKNVIRAGVDIVMHATYIDEEGLQLIAQHPPRAVVPALAWPKQFITQFQQGRISREHLDATHYLEDFEVGARNAKRLHGLGIRIIPGGEYGTGDNPHGTNARDLQIFVDDIGFTPMETICAATRDAAYLMEMQKDLGTLEAGKLADVLIVDGDPLANIAVLQDPRKIAVVMKSGEIQARDGKLLPV